MKKLWNSIYSFVEKTFSNSLSFLKNNSALAVKVTSELKKYVESPIADVVINLIPGTFDNTAVIILRKILPGIVTKMAIAHKLVQESAMPSECIAKIIEYLQGLNKDARTGFWITFAGELNKAMSDGKLTYAEAVILSQLAYKELYESKTS